MNRTHFLARLLVVGLVAVCGRALPGCGDAALERADGAGVGADGDGQDAGSLDGGLDGSADAGDSGPAEDGGGLGDAGGADPGDGGPGCAELPLPIDDRGELAIGDALTATPLLPCVQHRYRFAAPAGMVISFGLEAEPAGGEVEMAVVLPDAPDFEQGLFQRTTQAGASTSSFGVPRSGEYQVLVRAVVPDSGTTYRLTLACVQLCDRQTTRYPIVLVHGWTGWDEIGAYTYFYSVADTLAAHGFLVYTASLDPYNSVAVRSEQLGEQIGEFCARGRAERVNLIAHSQGGLDARRAISTLGYADQVASLTTISTPHLGTPIADVALGLMPGFAEDILAWFLEWLGATVVGSESDAIASFESITTAHVQGEFNPANPDAPGVAYISYAGKTCPFGLTCGDVCDIEIRAAYYILLAIAGANDGMVPVDYARWGDWRGEIPADHFDEIGQLGGITGPNFNHLEFYMGLAQNLAAEGF